MHKDFKETRVGPFVYDLNIDDLSQQIPPSSVDIVCDHGNEKEVMT